MNIILNLLLLTFVICFIVDVSGFFNFVKKFIASRLEGKYINLKAEDIKIPFVTCSLCSVWWAGIIYICIISEFTFVNLAIVALLAMLSSNISGFMFLIKDILATIEMWLQKLISK